MKILDILAKLGILRFGPKKATWTSGKDLPEELLVNDVFDAERDFTKAKELKAAKDMLTGTTKEKK